MRKNRINKIIILAFSMFMAPVLSTVTIIYADAAEYVVIDENVFPDATFREYVKANCDTDKDGKLSETEISSVTEIDVYAKRISDLSGIEMFSKLIKLNCTYNGLRELDVSSLSALEDLQCSYNLLSGLDVSSCGKLNVLECKGNNLTSINVSGCSELKKLDCCENQLTSLDVTECSALEKLWCNGNQLTSLDISNCPLLWSLGAYNEVKVQLNNVRQFDLSAFSGFDVSKVKSITGGRIRGNVLIVDVGANEVDYEYYVGQEYTGTYKLIPEITYSEMMSIFMDARQRIMASKHRMS